MIAKGVVSDGHGSFAIEELDVGEPQQGEVLVELAASGVCHTDMDLMRGVPILSCSATRALGRSPPSDPMSRGWRWGIAFC